MSENTIGLADAIRALRHELSTAMEEGEGEPVHFKLGPVEMEFLLEVQREGGAEAGIRFWVVNLGAKGSVTSGSTHRVTLALTPHDNAGKPIDIRDVEPR